MKAKAKRPPLRVGDLRRHPRGYNVREPWIDGCRPATGHQGRVSKYPLVTPSENP